jgi:hypothetical protein
MRKWHTPTAIFLKIDNNDGFFTVYGPGDAPTWRFQIRGVLFEGVPSIFTITAK